MNLQNAESVRYLGIEISRQGIAKVYGARVERFIARDEIREIHIKRGYPGERRLIQLGFGILLLAWAAWQILDLVIWLVGGGTRYSTDILILIFLIGVGGWLVWDATHSQLYLAVQTQEKTFKLSFDHKIDETALKAFLQYASQIGYLIDTSLLTAKT